LLSKQTNYPQLPKNITAEAADVGGRVVGEAVGVSDYSLALVSWIGDDLADQRKHQCCSSLQVSVFRTLQSTGSSTLTS